MSKMKEGVEAKLIQPAIAGTIVDTRYNKDAGQLEHLLSYAHGPETKQRWFLESELELV